MNANILVVDDEPEIAELVEVYLKSEGLSVVKCGTGTQALDALSQESIDLAILDVMLPDISGFALCGEIRKAYNFPVLMLTAKVEDMDKITGLTLSLIHIFQKMVPSLQLSTMALQPLAFSGSMMVRPSSRTYMAPSGTPSGSFRLRSCLYITGM